MKTANDILNKFQIVQENKPSFKAEGHLEKMEQYLDDNDHPMFFELLVDLNEFEPKSIETIMNDRKHPIHHNLFPSMWPNSSEYPKFLAEFLVKSKSKESITDYANQFYSRRNYSSGAKSVILKAAIAANGNLEYGESIKSQLNDYEALPNGFMTWIVEEPDTLLKLLKSGKITKELLTVINPRTTNKRKKGVNQVDIDKFIAKL